MHSPLRVRRCLQFGLCTRALAWTLCLASIALAQRPTPTQPADTEQVRLFRMESPLVTKFWGRPMFIEAGVVIPPEFTGEKLPVCYNIHGFGGSHRVAWQSGRALSDRIASGDYPRMIYVYLNAQFSLGHHEFADSVNCGPWGEALVTEFIPALEKYFHAHGTPEGRFVTGHSSGGWSSLWLQTFYPDFFGGTWSTAPDPVDFRDFTGMNIYEDHNAYVGPDGKEILFVRNGDQWRSSIRKYTQDEIARRSYGGQMASFDAVFSPRGPDGRPLQMFDRETGKIDRSVALDWRKYDISLRLRNEWPTLGPKLKGKLNIYCGTKDTYRLNDSLKLLEMELAKLGSDAKIVWAEGRGHSMGAADPVLWPRGMMDRIHREMWDKFQSNTSRPASASASAAGQ